MTNWRGTRACKGQVAGFTLEGTGKGTKQSRSLSLVALPSCYFQNSMRENCGGSVWAFDPLSLIPFWSFRKETFLVTKCHWFPTQHQALWMQKACASLSHKPRLLEFLGRHTGSGHPLECLPLAFLELAFSADHVLSG